MLMMIRLAMTITMTTMMSDDAANEDNCDAKDGDAKDAKADRVARMILMLRCIISMMPCVLMLLRMLGW